ncbi:MAG: glycosyl hydrolase, partial [Gemmatimonadota bacterium]|nr:glycosyl hydrolase [Gemmatimonadota bacterium]
GAVLFPVRDAWWYVPNAPMQAPGQPTLGTTAFTAPNPDFGATFTYWLADPPATMREERREAEKAAAGRGEDIAFPGYESLAAEALENGPRVAMLVRDEDGEPVRRVMGPATRGLHRVTWDLRRPAPDPVDLTPPGFSPPWAGPPRGPLAPPGRYTVEMALVTEAGVETLGTPRSFTVKPVLNRPPGTDHTAAMEFAQETAELQRRAHGAAAEIGRARDRLRHMRAALDATPRAGAELYRRLEEIEGRLAGIAADLRGDPAPGRLNQPSAPSIMGRIGQVAWGHWGTRQEPTGTQRASLAIAWEGFDEVVAALRSLLRDDLAALERDMEAAGAPWTPGRGVG